MDSDDVHRLDLSTEWTPDHVAAYLVEAEEGLILVDAGVPGKKGEEELRAEYARVGYSFEDTDALLVTHPHVDHDGHVMTVVDESDATVYAHEDVPERLSLDGFEERTRRYAREAGVEEEEPVQQRIAAVHTNRECLPPDEIDVLVGDGETFEVAGAEFEALHTPGHQAEHLSYAHNGLLFSGDALIEPFRSVIYDVGFDEGMYDAVGNCYETFNLLGERDAEAVYPGHGPVFDDPAAAAENSLGSLDALVESAHAAVGSLDEPTAYEVAVERKKPGHDVRHLIFDNIAALGYLEEQDRLTSYVEDGVRRYRLVETEPKDEENVADTDVPETSV